jgi:ferredoxin
VAPCAVRAVTLATERPDGFGAKRAVVDARRCTGCGDCVAPCPHGAMVLRRRGVGRAVRLSVMS